MLFCSTAVSCHSHTLLLSYSAVLYLCYILPVMYSTAVTPPPLQHPSTFTPCYCNILPCLHFAIATSCHVYTLPLQHPSMFTPCHCNILPCLHLAIATSFHVYILPLQHPSMLTPCHCNILPCLHIAISLPSMSIPRHVYTLTLQYPLLSTATAKSFHIYTLPCIYPVIYALYHYNTPAIETPIHIYTPTCL